MLSLNDKQSSLTYVHMCIGYHNRLSLSQPKLHKSAHVRETDVCNLYNVSVNTVKIQPLHLVCERLQFPQTLLIVTLVLRP